jgi:hypothetical protein
MSCLLSARHIFLCYFIIGARIGYRQGTSSRTKGPSGSPAELSPASLFPLVLGQRALAVAAGVLGVPVARCPLVDPELSGRLRDRLAGLPDRPHRALLGVLIDFGRASAIAHLFIGDVSTLLREAHRYSTGAN